MLSQYVTKVKSWISENKSDLYIAALIFLVGLSSFGLGRLSVLWPTKEPIRIIEHEAGSMKQETKESDYGQATISTPAALKGKYMASKSGKAYHYPWCPGALRIKEENKVWFQTKEEAESRGYKPAGNCEGL